MANPCFINYKGKDYTYEEFIALLHSGELDALIKSGELDINKLKGDYHAISIESSAKGLLRKTGEGTSEGLELPRMEQSNQPEETTGKGGEKEKITPPTGKVKPPWETKDKIKEVNRLATNGEITKSEARIIISSIKKGTKIPDYLKHKLPSFGEKKSISEREWLRDINSVGQRFKNMTFRELKEQRQEMITALKSLTSEERKEVTVGQIKSILNQLVHVTSESKFKNLQNYIEDKFIGTTEQGAKYKAQITKANKILLKLKDNKKKFGQAKPSTEELIDELKYIKADELSYEELLEFNKIAKDIFISNKVPNISNLLLAKQFFSPKLAEERKLAKEEADKAKTAPEIEDLITKAKDIKIEKLDDYFRKERALNAAKRRFAELKLTEDFSISDADLQKIENQLGTDLETGSGEIKKELDAYKETVMNYVVSKAKSTEVKNGINTFETKQEKETAENYIYTHPEAIKALSMPDLIAYNEGLDNIQNGNLTPYMLNDLATKLDVNYYVPKKIVPTLNKIINSKLWGNLINRKFVSWIDKVHPFQRENKRRSEEENLLIFMKSSEIFAIDPLLGNFDRQNTLINAYHRTLIKAIASEEHEGAIMDKTLTTPLINFKKGKSTGEQKKYLNWMGLFSIERRIQLSEHWDVYKKYGTYNNLIFNKGEINGEKFLKEANDQIRFEDEKVQYNDFMKFLREKNALDKKGDVEIINMEKATDVLSQNIKGFKELMKSIDDYYEYHKGMNKVAAISDGKILKYEDNYFPFISVNGTGRELNLDNLAENLTKRANGLKMRADATNEWTGKAMWLKTNPIDIALNNGDAIRKMYYLMPAMRNIVSEFREGTNVVSKEIDGAKHIDQLGRVLVDYTKDLINSYYHTGKYQIFKRGGDITSKFIRSTTKFYLGTPAKAVAEYGSNVIRVTSAMGAIPSEAAIRLNANKTTYNNLLYNFIPNMKLVSYNEDLLRSLNTGKTWVGRQVQKGEIPVDYLITFADTNTGRVFFGHEFIKNFNKFSGGVDFNEQKYDSDPIYRRENADAIQDASSFAMRRLEELLNGKTPLSRPQLVTFFGGLIKKEQSGLGVRVFNMMQSFGRREVNNIGVAVRKIKYGDMVASREGFRDLTAIFMSDISYGIMRKFTGHLQRGIMLLGVPALVKLITGKNKDEEKENLTNLKLQYYNEEKEQFKSGKFYLDYIKFKALPDIALGGTQNIFDWGTSIFYYVLQNTGGLDEDTKGKIGEYFDKRFIQEIPLYGSPESITKAIVPGAMGSAMGDVISAGKSFGYLVMAAYDAIVDPKERKFTEKDFLDICNIALEVSKIYAPNVAYPIAFGILKPHLSAATKVYKKEQSKEKAAIKKEKTKKEKSNKEIFKMSQQEGFKNTEQKIFKMPK